MRVIRILGIRQTANDFSSDKLIKFAVSMYRNGQNVKGRKFKMEAWEITRDDEKRNKRQIFHSSLTMRLEAISKLGFWFKI